jgi:hypothetical protein
MNRPSHKELYGKLRSAKEAVRDGRVALLNLLSLIADAIELEYVVEAELMPVLSELLDETTPADYTGRRPPDRSYEEDIKGLDLFAFTVQSGRFKCRVYYKFALAEEMMWLVSLHQDRPLKEE